MDIRTVEKIIMLVISLIALGGLVWIYLKNHLGRKRKVYVIMMFLAVVHNIIFYSAVLLGVSGHVWSIHRSVHVMTTIAFLIANYIHDRNLLWTNGSAH
jgi:hypothetical protein